MSSIPPTPNQWSETTSSLFIDLADIFVPASAEQTSTLLQLIPARPDEEFTLVELATGEGLQAEAILEHFSRCHYLALDGSATMRSKQRQRLARFDDRFEARDFELSSQTWRSQLPSQVRCVFSSLCVHHLDGSGKRQLFRDMRKGLESGGALLVADIIQPTSPQIAAFFAQQYDEIVREQSIALRGDLSGYEEFEKQAWNYFRYDYATSDQYDQPSPLYEQLRWLQEVNYNRVDCYWMRAGHAIYGGFK